jgi:hypothetical protein
MTCKCKKPVSNCENIDRQLYVCGICGGYIRPGKRINKNYVIRTPLNRRSVFWFLFEKFIEKGGRVNK